MLVSAGGITLAGTLTTTGAQTFSGAVTLDSNSTLASNGGNILFNNAINGARTLAITAGSGSVTFSASVGATTALTSLAVSSTHSTGITLTANVTTTGAQTYTGRVALAAAITLAGGSTSFSAALAAGAFALTISADEIDFNGGTGSVSGTAALVLQPLTLTEVQVGGSVTTAVLDLTVTDIAALANGFSSITIGSASSTLYMKLDGTSTFLDAIVLRTATDGSIEVMGALNAPEVTISTDGLTLAGSVTSEGKITIQPATSGRGISIISSSASAPAATLWLRDSNLSNTSATVLVLGNATTGAISLESNFSLGNTPTLHLISGSTVSQSERFVVVNLAVSSAGAITLLSSDNDITTLALAAATGNIQFTQARRYTVGTVDGVSGVIASAGSVALSVNGTITVNAQVSGTTGSLITGAGDRDTLLGSGGADVFTLTGANLGTLLPFGALASTQFINFETLDGGAGSDTLIGRNIYNTWTLTAANGGSVQGQAFQNMENLTGGTQGDTFLMDSGASFAGAVNGGTGADTLDYSTRSTAVSVNLATGSATSVGGAVSGIENVIGGSGNDTLTGDAGNNLLAGNAGNDILNGGAGNDTLIGGAGNDTYAFGDSWGTDSIRELDGEGADRLDFSSASNAVTITAAAAQSSTLSASASSLVNDTYINLPAGNVAFQYGPNAIQAYQAWALTSSGSASVVIAILDSGVQLTHQDLSGKIYRAADGSVIGYDFVNEDSDASDDNGHGTHVAGIAAATTGNSLGVAGIAPNARIMPVKVLGADGAGTLANIARGIRWAADFGARVINLSLGATSGSADLQAAIDYAYFMGVTIVAAAGNNGNAGLVDFPASYRNVISVGATNSSNALSSVSSTAVNGSMAFKPEGHQGVDLVAPGDGVVSTYLGNDANPNARYVLLSGTSQAAPYVSGVAALLAGLKQFDTPEKIRAALLNTALDLGATGRDSSYGYGLVQAAAAVRYAAPAGALAPLTAAQGSSSLSYTGNSIETVIGGAGNDTFEFAAERISFGVIDGGAGSNTISFAGYTSGVTVNLGANVVPAVSVFSNIQNITGGAGADVLTGDAGVNVLKGGAGDDELNGEAGDDTLYGNEGDDTLNGGAGNDTLYGNEGADTLNGNDGADTLYGNEGNDTLNGNDGADTLYGNEGDDTLNGNDGADTLYGNEGADTLNGNDGVDTLYGNEGDDTLNGDAGDDTLYGNAGADTLNGGAGNDTLYGNEGNDTLNGNEGADTLYGNDGDDSLYGGAGADTLYGGAGADLLDGGSDNDIFVFANSFGLDTLVERNNGGSDRLDFSAVSAALDFTVGSSVKVAYALVDMLLNIVTATDSFIEQFYGGSNGDHFLMSFSSTIGYALNGGGGDDVLFIDMLDSSALELTSSAAGSGSVLRTGAGLAISFAALEQLVLENLPLATVNSVQVRTAFLNPFVSMVLKANADVMVSFGVGSASASVSVAPLANASMEMPANGDGLRGTFVSAVSVVNNASTSYTVLFEQPANLSGSEALQVLRNSGGAWTVASGACINTDGQVEVDGTTQSEYVMLRANACN